MHEVKLVSLSVKGTEVVAIVDMTRDGVPLTLPGFRDPIADAVAAALGQPPPPAPPPIPLTGHPIIVPAAAIGSRQVMYEQASAEEAFDALLREHLARLASDIATPQTRAEAVERMKSDIGALKVTRPRKVEALVELGALIEEARAARIPRRRPQEEE